MKSTRKTVFFIIAILAVSLSCSFLKKQPPTVTVSAEQTQETQSPASAEATAPPATEAPTAEIKLKETATSPTENNQPPACTEAGQEWISPQDGMTLVCVPAGEFQMGCNTVTENEKPVHTVYLDAYWISKYEVNNSRFKQFTDATGYQTDAEKEAGWSFVVLPDHQLNWVEGANWLHPDGPESNLNGKEDYPVVQVSWNDATAYCAWAGGRLPTESEWEKAARGTDRRLYPWGDAIDNSYANYNGKGPVKTGSYSQGASPYGAMDMAGNICEWTADWFGNYPSDRQENPGGPTSGETRVFRGGAWASNNTSAVLSSLRNDSRPDAWFNMLGFRCVH